MKAVPKENISNEYLYYFLKQKSVFEYVDQLSIRTGGQTGVDLQCLRQFSLLLPPPEDQSRISSVLSTLDSKIELNHRINGELEGMAKLLYDYWFVQYDFPLSAAQAAALGKPRLAGQPYRTSGGKMLFNPTLKREIPKGWESGTAKDLFVFNPSISIKKGAVAAYLDMDALPTTGFMTKQIQRKEFNGGTKFTNGDVLVARITPCLENGKTGLVSLLEENEPAFGSTEFIVLRGRSLPLSSFACCLSRSEYFRKYAIGNMTGTSGRKRLEAPILEKLPLSIPATETLVAFEKICSPLFTLMTEHTKQNQELTALRDWLLPMLMNGQVRVG
jgi:type I restriction enzyme S subunit